MLMSSSYVTNLYHICSGDKISKCLMPHCHDEIQYMGIKAEKTITRLTRMSMNVQRATFPHLTPPQPLLATTLT